MSSVKKGRSKHVSLVDHFVDLDEGEGEAGEDGDQHKHRHCRCLFRVLVHNVGLESTHGNLDFIKL